MMLKRTHSLVAAFVIAGLLSCTSGLNISEAASVNRNAQTPTQAEEAYVPEQNSDSRQESKTRYEQNSQNGQNDKYARQNEQGQENSSSRNDKYTQNICLCVSYKIHTITSAYLGPIKRGAAYSARNSTEQRSIRCERAKASPRNSRFSRLSSCCSPARRAVPGSSA